MTHFKILGTHVVAELWGAKNTARPALLETAVCNGICESGATIITSHFHHFGRVSGVTGMVLLAESHLSIHTWPEHDYAALDIFMCGSCDPYRALEYLCRTLEVRNLQVSEFRRGSLLSEKLRTQPEPIPEALIKGCIHNQ